MAAFFFAVFSGLLLCSNAAIAAPHPDITPKRDTNLNTESVAKPVILKRPAAGDLPDITDIFSGYGIDELVDPMPYTPSPVSEPNTVRTPAIEDGLLLLELRLGKTILNEALVAYQEKGRLLLPLGQISEALQFPIRIDLDTKRAEGWFSEEDRTFLLDAANQRVIIGGRAEALSSNAFSLRDDDIFVDSERISQWFSIALDANMSEQILQVSGRDGMMLPAERLAERDIAREALKLKSTASVADIPITRTPYHLVTMPFADINLTANLDDRISPRTQANASMLMYGDLLYMQQSSYLSYRKDGGLADARFTLSRKDPEGKLLQADEMLTSTWFGEQVLDWRLSEFAVGDLVSRQLPLTMLTQNGRGVTVSNQPLDRSDRFDRTSIRGDVQPGWDVELYRNDELLAFQRSNANGRYEFDDVPLLSGLNVIRLVFYGPFGQTREEIQRVLVSPNITEEGASYMRLTAMEQGSSLFGSNTGQGAFASNFAIGLSNITPTSAAGDMRMAFEYEYGLLNNLATYAQVTHTPITGKMTNDAVTLGLGGVWRDIYGRVNIAQGENGGRAGEVLAQTNIMGLNLSLEHQRFDDFLSDYTEDVLDPVEHRTTARIDGGVHIDPLPYVSLGIAAARTAYVSGRVRDELNQRTTTNLLGFASLNHNTTFTRDHNPSTASDAERASGSLLLNVPAFGAFFRGGVSYQAHPETSLDNAALAVDYNVSETLFLRSEIFRQMDGDAYNSANLSLTRRFSHVSLGASTGANDKGEMFAGISLGFAIGQEPRTGELCLFNDPVSSSGMVSAHTYVDENNNQQKDAGEESIEGAGYLIDGGATGSRNQKHLDDVALLTYLPAYSAATMTIYPTTLDDPFLVAGDQGARIITRPGVPALLDFAVRRAADVEGLVTMRKQSGETVEAANVLVEAVDANGHVARSARTAFDGVYLLELVPSGEYTIRISEAQTTRLGFKETTQQSLHVRGDEEYIQDINLSIRR